MQRLEAMIRFRLQELIANKGYEEKRNVTLDEISEATGIHRVTLSRISNKVGYSTSTNVLGLLCEYFDCEVGDIAERVKNEQP
jgi:putative transcriptional regulator